LTFKYDFRTTNGAVCCQGDNPNHLCTACKARLRPPGVPEAPRLADVIQQDRATKRPLGRHTRGPQQALAVMERQARALQYQLAAPRPMSTGRLP
jgi:hypothetical protein